MVTAGNNGAQISSWIFLRLLCFFLCLLRLFLLCLNLCAFASLREIFLRSRIGVTVLTKILQFERIIVAKPYFF
jgi:hypothetical protein